MKRSYWMLTGLIIGAQALAWGVGMAADRVALSHPAESAAMITDDKLSPRQTVADLRAAVAAGRNPVVLDLRDKRDFAEGHIPGAILVPFSGLQKWASKQDAAMKARPVVLYCACHAEHTSAVGVVMLSRLGFQHPTALKGGWIDWLASKAPIQKGSVS